MFRKKVFYPHFGGTDHRHDDTLVPRVNRPDIFSNAVNFHQYIFTFVIITLLYRYVKHQWISIIYQHSIMILLGSTDGCSIICHVVHHHSVDHIAGVQLGKSDDDDDEGFC